MTRTWILAAALPLCLAGCYSGHWDEAEVMVTTMPPGAACTLTRAGKPIAEVNPTPGIALVSRTGDDITVACRRNGYAEATAVSHARGHAVDFDTLWQGRPGWSYESPVALTLAPQAAGATAVAR